MPKQKNEISLSGMVVKTEKSYGINIRLKPTY